MEFSGYLRPDGRVGVRNKLLIVALDECCDGLARGIAEGEPEAVVLTNHYTCMLGGNEETFLQLAAVCANPNVAAVLVVAMGCGSILIDHFVDAAKGCGKPFESVCCIQCGGTRKAVREGREKLARLAAYARAVPRGRADLSLLTVGVKCGGSDTSSGIASNPSVGAAADLLVDLGATVIAGELIELTGCGEVLARRCVTPETAQAVLGTMENELARWNVPGAACESMSIGNCVGGLTTIEEKSLGALHKTGTRPIQGVLQINREFIDAPPKPGFYLSDVSHLCGAAGVNFAALGAHLILWTTGAAGFDTALVPTIKVSGNRDVFNEDMDVDATGVMEGAESAASVGRRILETVRAVADGQPTRTEGVGSSFLTLYQKDLRLETLLGIRYKRCPMA